MIAIFYSDGHQLRLVGFRGGADRTGRRHASCPDLVRAGLRRGRRGGVDRVPRVRRARHDRRCDPRVVDTGEAAASHGDHTRNRTGVVMGHDPIHDLRRPRNAPGRRTAPAQHPSLVGVPDPPPVRVRQCRHQAQRRLAVRRRQVAYRARGGGRTRRRQTIGHSRRRLGGETPQHR